MAPDASRLRLRALRTSDEDVFAEAHLQFLDEDFEFGIHYEPGMPWHDYLQAVSDQSLGLNLPDGWVRNTRLVADVDGVLVGRTSVRHELNDFLLQYGGHIGYAVVPDQRRRGYATEILRQSIAVAHTIGVDRVLVTCDGPTSVRSRPSRPAAADSRTWCPCRRTMCPAAATGSTDGCPQRKCPAAGSPTRSALTCQSCAAVALS